MANEAMRLEQGHQRLKTLDRLWYDFRVLDSLLDTAADDWEVAVDHEWPNQYHVNSYLYLLKICALFYIEGRLVVVQFLFWTGKEGARQKTAIFRKLFE